MNIHLVWVHCQETTNSWYTIKMLGSFKDSIHSLHLSRPPHLTRLSALSYGNIFYKSRGNFWREVREREKKIRQERWKNFFWSKKVFWLRKKCQKSWLMLLQKVDFYSNDFSQLRFNSCQGSSDQLLMIKMMWARTFVIKHERDW